MWDDARCAARLVEWERLSGAATPTLIAALEPVPGDRLLDVGCGLGAATLRVAERVGARGAVLGADDSPPLVAAATSRARAAGATDVAFVVADVETDRLAAAPFTAAMSSFGVMFFADPVAALARRRTTRGRSPRSSRTCWHPYRTGGRPVRDRRSRRRPAPAARRRWSTTPNSS